MDLNELEDAIIKRVRPAHGTKYNEYRGCKRFCDTCQYSRWYVDDIRKIFEKFRAEQ